MTEKQAFFAGKNSKKCTWIKKIEVLSGGKEVSWKPSCPKSYILSDCDKIGEYCPFCGGLIEEIENEH